MNKECFNSFHTHTYLCKHATGTPVDYVRVASEQGCSALGFSDHCPYPNDDIWNNCRMNANDVSLYLKMVSEARQEASFPVFLGFECEWLPEYESWYRDYLRFELGAEYLVFGSHWQPKTDKLLYAPSWENTHEMFDYIEFTIQGLQTGFYDFLAHPDLFLAFCTHIDSDLLSASSYLIDACVDLNIPMEINGAGSLLAKLMRDGVEESPYPCIAFWQLAQEKKATIICNSDAHNKRDVLYGASSARAFAKKHGIEVTDFLPILQAKLNKC